MINQIAEMVVDNQVSFDDAEKQINAAVAAASEALDEPDYELMTDFGVNAIAMVDNSPRPIAGQQASAVASDSSVGSALKGFSAGTSTGVSGIGNRPGQQSTSGRTGAGTGWGAGYCWKCNGQTYADCAQNGSYEQCPSGDEDCCFLEVTKTDREVLLITSGCKDFRACVDMKRQNFAEYYSTGKPHPTDQCKPMDSQQNRYPGQASVCRQCFATCDINGSNGKYCLHHGTGDYPMGSGSIVAANVNSLKINSWNNLLSASATYYDLEDSVTGGETMNFWYTDLLTQSIQNWGGLGKSIYYFSNGQIT